MFGRNKDKDKAQAYDEMMSSQNKGKRKIIAKEAKDAKLNQKFERIESMALRDQAKTQKRLVEFQRWIDKECKNGCSFCPKCIKEFQDLMEIQ